MKVAFNRIRRSGPWGGGSQFLTMLADSLIGRGHHVIHKLESDVDAIVMFDPRYEDGGFDVDDIRKFKYFHGDVKVLHRINDSDIPRNTTFLDNLNIGANVAVADETVFISKWLHGYYVGKGFPTDRPRHVITNGCDERIFYPKAASDLSEPTRLVTHHWSDNYMKGFDLYIHIDQLLERRRDVEFTYIGRYCKTYSPKNTKLIQPLYGVALADEIRKHDVYVTAARYEACGMHHIEGAACGLPVVYHEDGGGAAELCGRYGVPIKDPGEFEAALQRVLNDYGSLRAAAIGADDLKATNMCNEYVSILERMTKP